MNIHDIAYGLWQQAKQGPVQKWINIEGYKIKVTCIRQVCDCGCHVRFIFWINPNPAPWSLLRRVRQAFIPNGIMYPGENGELIQYIQEVGVFDREIRRLLAAKPLLPPSGQDYRVSGDALCPVCNHPIRLHPLDPDELSYDKRPFLIVLCNGDRVKT